MVWKAESWRHVWQCFLPASSGCAQSGAVRIACFGMLPIRRPRRWLVLRALCLAICLVAIAIPAVQAKAESLTTEQRAELIRNLNAEYGSAKIQIPRSKKPLVLRPTGQYDMDQWSGAMMKFGPAARVGDLVQITAVRFEGKKLVFDINHGMSGGRKWWHRIQVGGAGGRGSTLGQMQNTHAPGGTKLALVFPEAIPVKPASEFKAMLEPILDFGQRSATEMYLDTIDTKYREAIEKKQVIEGMDKEMVLLAKGRPVKKVRDFKDGVETEDWIYGEPPGEIVFVTFLDGDVIGVKESIAAIGGWVKETPQIQR